MPAISAQPKQQTPTGAADVVRLNAQQGEEVIVTKQPVSNLRRSQFYTGMPDIMRLTLLMDPIDKLEAKRQGWFRENALPFSPLLGLVRTVTQSNSRL